MLILPLTYYAEQPAQERYDINETFSWIWGFIVGVLSFSISGNGEAVSFLEVFLIDKLLGPLWCLTDPIKDV